MLWNGAGGADIVLWFSFCSTKLEAVWVGWHLAIHRMEYMHSYFGNTLHSGYLYLCCYSTGEKKLQAASRNAKPTVKLDRSVTYHNLNWHQHKGVSFTEPLLSLRVTTVSYTMQVKLQTCSKQSMSQNPQKIINIYKMWDSFCSYSCRGCLADCVWL